MNPYPIISHPHPSTRLDPSARTRPDGATPIRVDGRDATGRGAAERRAREHDVTSVDFRPAHGRNLDLPSFAHARPGSLSLTETHHHHHHVDVLLGDDANPGVGARGDANVGTPNDGASERNEIYPGRRATHRGDRARRG